VQVRRMLTVEDREEITRGLAAGLSYRQIAALIGRDASVVSREVCRGGGRGFYRALRSDKAAAKARCRPKLHKLAHQGRLRETVLGMLGDGLSPDQVAGRLRVDFPDDESMRISHEAIYSWIYALPVGELARLGVRLRSGRPRRKAQGKAERTPRISNMRWIDDRPAEAEGRQVPGHWEGDLIIGKNGATAASTLVERMSRYLILIPLQGKDSPHVTTQIAEHISGLPQALRRSLTWDCGGEMAAHADLSLAANIDVYFAHPHSPWERGTNEQTNRWIREYLPKGTPITNDPDQLAAIADQLNRRPRRILGYRTPAEVFAELLTSPNASTS
jgi:transposase, IS30 family